MDSNTDLPPIERWWPKLTISAKHELLKDLDAQISEAVLNEIESLLECSIPRSPQHLNNTERAFIDTQTEVVD
ncbi:hypothetical protein [Rhodoglobus aureus]|uniref:Uncharacterized protein n=1 Tax=Rhodoglobus aureus TaxID=191497 RepID=A0ABP4GCR1_9MICO